MKKLKLKLEDLAVDAFSTTAAAGDRGTVVGHSHYTWCWQTCPDTCAQTCDDATCAGFTCGYESCGGTCFQSRCVDTCLCN
jgi:hypothetical protein